MKLSTGKFTLVEDKQIWRRAVEGYDVEDVISLRHEVVNESDARPLLQCVMQAGQLVTPLPSLAEARMYHAEQVARLPVMHQLLRNGEPYPVRLSAGLDALQQRAESALRQHVRAGK